MTSTSPSSAHAYFKALEEAFIRLRGAPLLLSPSDWQIAKGWRERGIPLELAVRVMERIFERQESAEKKKGIRSLRYFRAAVERSWKRVEDLGAGGSTTADVAPIDIEQRLERLAAALDTCDADAISETLLPVREGALEGLAGRVRALKGEAQAVDKALRDLDRALLERVRVDLGPEGLASYERVVEAHLARIADRVTADTLDETADLLLRRELRRELGLPILSLFSPDARGTGDPF